MERNEKEKERERERERERKREKKKETNILHKVNQPKFIGIFVGHLHQMTESVVAENSVVNTKLFFKLTEKEK